jgi:FHA domain
VVVSFGMVIGRTGSDIELADPEVSRRHATFRSVDGEIAVEDLGSSNGTFVNEQPVQGIVTLKPGDTVRFGNTVWKLGGEEGATVVASTRPAEAPAAPAPAPEPADRGDRPPTGIRQAIGSEPVYGEALPQFDPSRAPSPVLGRSAARRLEVTLYSYAVVIATAVAVVIYFIQR